MDYPLSHSQLQDLKPLLDKRVAQYNTIGFIKGDPICIPHHFSKREDIEIAGFFAATLAWGNRTSIINSLHRLMDMMGNSPHQFIIGHEESDLKTMLGFVHRTFNATDLLYLISVLRKTYLEGGGLESLFVPTGAGKNWTVQESLIHFHENVFEGEHPDRTRKHIATPARGSACKRLNMYLRWMVRKDKNGVDFGLWKRLKPAQLICPLDVHVARVAHRLGLLPNEKSNWANATLLTEQLRILNSEDPSVYDYALFSLGAEERY